MLPELTWKNVSGGFFCNIAYTCDSCAILKRHQITRSSVALCLTCELYLKILLRHTGRSLLRRVKIF